MADAYIGEIRLFCGTYAPSGWLFCWGQVLPVQEYNVLYSIIGNIYGGTAPSTFALPDLRGSVPLHQGAGPGLTPRTIAEDGGAATVTLSEGETPNHTHAAQGVNGNGTGTNPVGAQWAQHYVGGRTPEIASLYAAAPNTLMNPLALAPTGGGQPHNNMQPYLPINFIICLDAGDYPVRG